MEIGRIAPTLVAVEIDYGNHTPEPGDILPKIAGGGEINAKLDHFRSARPPALRTGIPRWSGPNPGYRRLGPEILSQTPMPAIFGHV